MPEVTILSPQKPALGMLSWPDAASLPPGYWARLANVRLDRRNLTVRPPCADLQATYGGDSPSACLGAWSGGLNGTNVVLAAQVVSGATRIYRSTDGVTFTELSNGAGVAYPNSRLTSTTEEVSFAVVRDSHRDRDVVVVSNGVDTPKVYDALDTDGASSNFVSHESIEAPAQADLTQVVMGERSYFKLSAGGTPCTTEASGTGTSGFYFPALVPSNFAVYVDSSTSVGDAVYYSHNTEPKDFSGRQMAFLVRRLDSQPNEDSWDLLFPNVEIYVSEDTAASNPPTKAELAALNWTKVYDPDEEEKYQLTVVEEQTRQQADWVLLDLRAVPAASRNAVRHIKIVWTGTPPSGADIKEFYIQAIVALGDVPGMARHSVTYYNSKSRSESPAAVLPEPLGAAIGSMGGHASIPSERLPSTTAAYYDYRTTLTKYAQAVADAGVDRIRLYRRDTGDTEYRLAQEQVSATVNYGTGVWSAANGAFGSSVTLTDDAPPEELDWTVTAPGTQHLCIPVGAVIASANARLWSASGSTLRVSELDQPFRFLDATRFLADADGNLTQEVDVRSPVRHTLHGERVLAVAPIDAGSSANSSANQLVYVLTDSAVYAASGFDALSLSRRSRLSSVGLSGKGAYATGNQSLYWVGDDQVLWRMQGGQAAPLSRFRVGELSDVPASRRASVRLLWNDSKVYCAYTPSGTANTELLIYDELLDAFYLDALPSSRSAERIARFKSTAGTRVMCFGGTGQVTEHAQVASLGSSLESTVAVTLKTAQITDDLLEGFVIRSVSALADDSDGASLTAVASWEPYSSTSTFTVPLDSATGSAWKRSAEPAAVTFDANDRGGSGVGAQVTFTCSLPAGKRIRALHLETEQRAHRRAER